MRKAAYLYNESITNYKFSLQHPMKPMRLKMCHQLVQSYGMNDHLMMFQSKEATKEEICSFHDPYYVDYLEKWVTGKRDEVVTYYKEDEKRKIRDDSKLKNLFKVNQSFDCPGFDGLYHYCQLAVGGSIDAADMIITGISDVAINWGGGYHHAKKTEASGFCYVNDIVVCILELLKVYPRVLYLDIDVHHGDGVQQAFYNSNRCMTVSFHEFDEDFFPGTGALTSVGEGIGKFFSVNVPLKKGIDDTSYFQLFKKVMNRVMGSYSPDVVVMQCGADSLSKDRLGHLNLSIKGHAACVDYMLKFGTPMVFLGGGGYTIENVSRCWTYQTSVIIGSEIENDIPTNEPFKKIYESQNCKLHFDVEKRPNENTQSYLDGLVEVITENLRQSEIRPSIAFHSVPSKYLPEQDLEWKMIGEEEDSFEDSDCEHVFQEMKTNV